jgi:hypothetical protein
VVDSCEEVSCVVGVSDNPSIVIGASIVTVAGAIVITGALMTLVGLIGLIGLVGFVGFVIDITHESEDVDQSVHNGCP